MPLRIKKIILVIVGSTAIALGFLGIILPVLPTTPFLLIAAYCYARSSEQMYCWLIHHRILGVYIYNYLEHRAIPRSTKIVALSFLWTTLTITMLIIANWYVRAVILVAGVCVTIHILTLKALN